MATLKAKASRLWQTEIDMKDSSKKAEGGETVFSKQGLESILVRN
jgi:hypothetical protein